MSQAQSQWFKHSVQRVKYRVSELSIHSTESITESVIQVFSPKSQVQSQNSLHRVKQRVSSDLSIQYRESSALSVIQASNSESQAENQWRVKYWVSDSSIQSRELSTGSVIQMFRQLSQVQCQWFNYSILQIQVQTQWFKSLGKWFECRVTHSWVQSRGSNTETVIQHTVCLNDPWWPCRAGCAPQWGRNLWSKRLLKSEDVKWKREECCSLSFTSLCHCLVGKT